MGSRDNYQESNLYSSLAQGSSLVALFVLIEVRFDKKKCFTLWVLSVDMAPCQPSGTKNFEIALRFLENLCTTGYEILIELVEGTLTIFS